MLPSDMPFLLNSQNVFTYLAQAGLWEASLACDRLERQPGKNFNLRIKGGGYDLLIKQETHYPNQKSSGELAKEWWFYQLLRKQVKEVPALAAMRSHIIWPLHFDAENSILVFPFLNNVCDLSSFYSRFCKEESESLLSAHQLPVSILPTSIAIALGETVAKLHSSTFQKQSCRDFLLHQYQLAGRRSNESKLRPDFLAGLRRLTPASFSVIPTDALKFFRFYQRYPDIGEAIESINQTFDGCCVVHNDPRFANFLLHDADSFTASNLQATVQAIDWEKWTWGDPAYDLAQLVANYLKLWLKSLPVSANLSLNDTLNRATVPLVAIQPSTEALLRTYLAYFPQIRSHQPEFVVSVVQLTGLSLVRQVQLYIAQKHPVGNIEMAMVQVAKSLLCQPEAAISTVFGRAREDIEASASQAIAQPV